MDISRFIEVEVNGKTYKLRKTTQEDWVEIKKKIVAARKNPFKVLREMRDNFPEMSDTTFDKLTMQAYEDAKSVEMVSPQEMWEFFCAPENSTYINRMALKHNHPDITDAEVEEVTIALGERTQRELSGVDAPDVDTLVSDSEGQAGKKLTSPSK